METLHDKLRKIEALATSGIDGERENARRLMDLLCAKYKLSPEQFTAPEKKFYRFACVNQLERELLSQIVVTVCRTRQIRNIPGRVARYELTAAQEIDVSDAFRHYRKELASDASDLMVAFIHKHALHGPREDEADDEKEGTAEDRERAKRIFGMMQSMGSETMRRAARLTA